MDAPAHQYNLAWYWNIVAGREAGVSQATWLKCGLRHDTLLSQYNTLCLALHIIPSHTRAELSSSVLSIALAFTPVAMGDL